MLATVTNSLQAIRELLLQIVPRKTASEYEKKKLEKM